MSDTIQPGHVLARVLLLEAEVEILRAEMGKPVAGRTEIDIRGAAPREVYFEALALFRKADRFAFERVGSQGVLPQAPSPAAIEPVDVRNVVDAALRCVRAVKARMNIAEQASEPAPDTRVEPSNVFAAIARTCRQLNLLLDTSFLPDDCFQQVCLGLGYAAPLLARASVEAPSLPDFEGKKRPADCYRRLRGGYSALRETFDALGLGCAELGEVPYEDAEIVPNDVYDLASLLIAELVYLHAKVPGVAPPAAAEFYEVERRLPAHVYQYAGYLEAYLSALSGAAKASPGAFRA